MGVPVDSRICEQAIINTVRIRFNVRSGGKVRHQVRISYIMLDATNQTLGTRDFVHQTKQLETMENAKQALTRVMEAIKSWVQVDRMVMTGNSNE